MASILLAGGGTAGHVNPLLATASELVLRGHAVAALGTAEGLEAELVPRAGVALHTIKRVPFPRKLSMAWLRFPGELRGAVRAAAAAIDQTGADAVVGFGGYVSTPAYLAARRRKIPYVVHEANARPGLANRWGARKAARTAITFAGTPLPRAILTGLPLRSDIQALAELLSSPETAGRTRAAARRSLGWAADAPTLLVTGGSLGAASLNAATVDAVPALVSHGVHLLHLTGRGKSEAAERARGGLSAQHRAQYVVMEYAHDMASAFAAADAVVCRAGAATVSEISALGIPAVYVPLPYGNGEQALNAAPAAAVGAAVIIADADLTPAALEQQAERLVLDQDIHDLASGAASRIGIRDGASRLAGLVEEVLVKDGLP